MNKATALTRCDDVLSSIISDLITPNTEDEFEEFRENERAVCKLLIRENVSVDELMEQPKVKESVREILKQFLEHVTYMNDD